MNEALLIALGAGLGGMFGWGLADFFAKKTIDEIGDIQSLTWGHIFGTGLFLLLAFGQFLFGSYELFIPTGSVWWGIVLFGILQAVIYLLVYKGFSKGQLSVLAPIFASFSGIAALISILFLGEMITGSIVGALILLFIGLLLINIDGGALQTRKINFLRVPGFKEISIATVLAAIWTLGWDALVGGRDSLVYSLFMYLFMTIAIILFAKFKKVKFGSVKKTTWGFLFLIGFCELVAYLAITIGYSATSKTSVVALLSGAFSLPTIILARIFLKEKLTKPQIWGVVVIITGILFISLV
jgi:drug/metabolite transporter (DMT)-like permease